MVKVRKDAETISGSFLRELGPTSTYSGMDNTRRYGRRNLSSNLGRCTRPREDGSSPSWDWPSWRGVTGNALGREWYRWALVEPT